MTVVHDSESKGISGATIGDKRALAVTDLAQVGAGRTLIPLAINQSGAATTELIPAQPDERIYLVSYEFTISATGTVQFLSGTDALSGPMDFTGTGGMSAQGAVKEPLTWTGVNKALNLTSTGGGVKGMLTYFVL